jgi:uncharacterized protein YkwD
MTRVAAIVVTLTLVLCGGAWAQRQTNDSDAEQEIFGLVNHERVSRGLEPLVIDKRLTSAARAHSAIMAHNREIAHQFDHESTVEVRLGTTGLHFSRSGENVATAGDAASAHDALMHSPGHRANILKPEFNSVGIGVVRDGDQIYVTQDFALRTAELSVAEAERSVIDQFNRLRQSAGAAPLALVEAPAMRQGACEMAKANELDASAFGRGGRFPVARAQNIVVYTSADVTKLPDSLTQLRGAQGGGVSVGVCYARSASYVNPVYWVAVVIKAKEQASAGR